MRIWVTRTLPGAERTAERLRDLGHEPVVRPVLVVRRLYAEIDLAGVAALAFTSANGVEALAALTPDRRLPVFAVGAATAAAARAAGFGNVRSAEGDVEALAALIAADPPGGAVMHAAGRPRAGDLQGALEARGVRARTVELYETVAADAPPPEPLDAVLVHSPHAARVLAAGPLDRARAVFCLSPAAASPLLAAGFAAVRAAARPDERSLLALLPRHDLGARPEGR